MNGLFPTMYVKHEEFRSREDGQDLVDHALQKSLIALAAITGVQSVTKAITTDVQQHRHQPRVRVWHHRFTRLGTRDVNLNASRFTAKAAIFA